MSTQTQDPDYTRLLTDPSTILDVPHHDVPERHLIGGALIAPGIPRPVGTTSADTTAGKSSAPARADHVHDPGNHAHSGYSPTSHTHTEQNSVGGKRILTAPTSGTLTGLTGAVSTLTNFIVQGGTLTGVTDASGYINVVYPVRFPTGVLSFICSIGFIYALLVTASDGNFNQDYHQMRVWNVNGSALVSGAVRINWIAVGW